MGSCAQRRGLHPAPRPLSTLSPAQPLPLRAPHSSSLAAGMRSGDNRLGLRPTAPRRSVTPRSRPPFRCGWNRQVGAGENSSRPRRPGLQGKEEEGAWVWSKQHKPFQVPSTRSLWAPPGSPGRLNPCRGGCSARRPRLLCLRFWAGAPSVAKMSPPRAARLGSGWGCLSVCLSGGVRVSGGSGSCWRGCAAGGDARQDLPSWQPPRLLHIPAEGLSCF